MSGKFIVFEGLDGSGITTQAGLLKSYLTDRGLSAYLTKEPTDGPVGAQIRLALSKRLYRPDPLSGEVLPLDEETMALLFAADRMDHLHAHILPRLAQGATVISDRYMLSSFAYQSTAADLAWIQALNSKARQPDLTIFISVPPAEAQRRIHANRWHVELYEELGKLSQVYENFHRLAHEMQARGEAIVIIDGTRSSSEVHAQVTAHVARLFA